MKKIVQELKWIGSSPSMIVVESKSGNKGTYTASDESKAKEKEFHR